MDTNLKEQLKRMSALAGLNESEDWGDILNSIRQLAGKLHDLMNANQSMLSGESGRNINGIEALSHEFGDEAGKKLADLLDSLDDCYAALSL